MRKSYVCLDTCNICMYGSMCVCVFSSLHVFIVLMKIPVLIHCICIVFVMCCGCGSGHIGLRSARTAVCIVTASVGE